MALILDEAGNPLPDEAGNFLLDETGLSFPDLALGLDIELLLNGTWTSVKSRLDHGPVEISRGHPDESVTVAPSTVTMTLTNGDGYLSPENAMGAAYPYITQNMECRVSVPAQQNYLRLEADSSSYASCPDAAGLHVTGDLDIRLDMQLTGWQVRTLAAKWPVSAGQQCWLLQLDSDGTLQLFWSTDGSNFPSASSTAAIPPWQRLSVRATLAVATGTVTFYTGAAGAADGSTWTQLGNAVVTGATSIFAGTAPVTAGNRVSGAAGVFGNLYELEVRSGIGGTVVAHPVFSSQAAGTTSFSDAQSNTWTLSGTAEISSRLYRGHFEIAELPAEEPPYNPAANETSGKTDVLSAFAGGGLLRRLSQRNSPLNSPMYRAWAKANAGLLAAYWPMEDGADATQFASGSGGRPMFFSGTPTLASNSDFACSNALPVINGANTSGQVAYTGTWTDNQVAFLMEVPAAGEANGAVIAQVATTGSIVKLTLTYGTGGSLTLAGFNASGSQVLTGGPVSFGVNGQKMLIALALQNTPGGGTVTWHIDGFAVGAASPTGLSGTIGASIGAVTGVQLNPNGALTQTVPGHCAVLTQYQQLYNLFTYTNPYGLVTGALNAWAGEPAAVRFARLCSEEGVSCRITGAMNGTLLMGPQTAQTLTQLLQECADADRGVWYELRQALGWGYVCRSALYNQAAQVTADYTQDYLSPWRSPPLRDDQVIVNDVTLTQSSGTGSTAGSSSRAYAVPGQPVPGGRLSTLSPAAGGAGTYDQAYSINAYQASDLDSLATWIVHIGTVDRRRFPGIMLDLASRGIPAAAFWAALALDLGQRVTIANPPPWLGYDTISQLAQQLTERLDALTLEIEVAGVPEDPYEVLTAGSGRIDTDGTTLGSGVSSSATSLSFVTAAGFPVWTTSAGDFPFDVMIAGERMTVTNITGSSSPQTATVTRSVNGVVKAQASGAAVNVYPPVAIGL